MYIIAEMACAHEGSKSLAKKIITSAGIAGASAIQFQVWALDDLISKHHPNYSLVQKLELKFEEWKELASFSQKNYPQMDLIITINDEMGLKIAQWTKCKAVKIHASDLTNLDLLKKVVRLKARIDLSVGGATLDEITQAVSFIRQNSNQEIWLMYGIQSFPTPLESIHLHYLKTLQDLYHLQVGYQDHTDAELEEKNLLCIASLGLGVCCIEKHITHDRSIKGTDYQSSLNPDEFKKFVSEIHLVEKAMERKCLDPCLTKK